MNKLLLPIGLSMLMACGQSAQASAFQKADFEGFTRSFVTRANSTERQWAKAGTQLTPSVAQRVISQAEAVTEPSSYWGSLNAPNGEEWMYTMEFTYDKNPVGQSTISSALITIYDSNFNVYRTLKADFSLQEHDTTINSVQISPTLTKKFFNINDDYEIMVMAHATTDDYTGRLFTQVYTLKDGSLVTTLDGDNVGAINTATDAWSEKYTLLFMREETVITEDSYDYYLYFDVYSRAGWGGSCNLEHTFKVDYRYFSGAGNRALPILMNSYDNHIYYALPRYEKEYFASQFGEDVTPDNNFLIDLYDEDFNLLKTTSIPIELESGAAFSFPGLGELRGNLDMMFGIDGNSGLPLYVVGVENYVASNDDFTTSLYLYDADGNKLQTIVNNAFDYLMMSDVVGFEDQFCFYFPDDNAGKFKFIDIPSNTEVAEIPLMLDGMTISTSIDRAPFDGSYKYASSVLVADVDENENTIHKIAWYNADGSYDRTDRINLGKSIALAMVNVLGEALNPFLFNTDEHLEYMFLVKQYTSPTSSSSKEYLRIYNDQSELLLDIGENDKTGEHLNSIFLMNTTKANPKLIVSYYSYDDLYTLHSIDLPFSKFAGGEGTKDQPYLIASAGDLKAIQTAPNAYYELACDIDGNYVPWYGNQCDFTGVLDGKGHTISNLNLIGSGMFSTISNEGKVTNLNIKGVKMLPTHDGGIIASTLEGGEGTNKATISNVAITDVVVESDARVSFGGLVGLANLYAVIEGNSITNAHINLLNATEVGGLVGSIYTSTSISNSLFDGWINAPIAGGIVGTTSTGDESITNCHAHVEITADEIAGGIVGSSRRTAIKNCFVDGNISAVGAQQAYSGGITGELWSSYEEVKPIVIENCIVAANVTVNKEAAKAVAHRITGLTSGDQKVVDWESNDPNVDWSDPSTYPYIDGEPETAIKGNIAIVAENVANPVVGDASTPDGMSLSKDQLTDDILARYNWSMNTVWKKAGSALALVNESFALTAVPETLNINPENAAEVTVEFVCDSRYANLIKVESSDNQIASVGEVKISEDGKSAICTISINATGNCSIKATLDNNTAVCNVVSSSSSLADVISESIVYDGNNVMSEGRTIRVYDISGKLVAEGYEAVSIAKLANGAYIVTNGKDSIKILK